MSDVPPDGYHNQVRYVAVSLGRWLRHGQLMERRKVKEAIAYLVRDAAEERCYRILTALQDWKVFAWDGGKLRFLGVPPPLAGDGDSEDPEGAIRFLVGGSQ